jgi:hypothetical protein
MIVFKREKDSEMRIGFGILAAAAVALMCAQTPAMAQPRHAKAGTLDCTLAPSVGLIIGSRQRMDCRFIPDRGGRVDHYSGTVRRLGLDIGVTTWCGAFSPAQRA